MRQLCMVATAGVSPPLRESFRDRKGRGARHGDFGLSNSWLLAYHGVRTDSAPEVPACVRTAAQQFVGRVRRNSGTKEEHPFEADWPASEGSLGGGSRELGIYVYDLGALGVAEDLLHHVGSISSLLGELTAIGGGRARSTCIHPKRTQKLREAPGTARAAAAKAGRNPSKRSPLPFFDSRYRSPRWYAALIAARYLLLLPFLFLLMLHGG